MRCSVFLICFHFQVYKSGPLYISSKGMSQSYLGINFYVVDVCVISGVLCLVCKINQDKVGVHSF